MRESFHNELADLIEQLVGMCHQAAEAMRDANRALLHGDRDLAEKVLSTDALLDARRAACEEAAYAMLALQAPVARDLRTVLGAVYSAEKIERMGDLAAHIAQTARFHHPGRPVPDELTAGFTELGETAVAMAQRLADVIASSDQGGYAELQRTDHRVDAVHASVMAAITSEDWPHGPRSASTLALLARFHERFADQAVSVAKHVEFTATGTVPDAAE